MAALPTPPIVQGNTDKERLDTLYRYLFRLVDSMNLKLDAIETEIKAKDGET